MKDSDIASVWNGNEAPAGLVAENPESITGCALVIGRSQCPLKIMQGFKQPLVWLVWCFVLFCF